MGKIPSVIINIVTQTGGPKRQGFGKLLFLGEGGPYYRLVTGAGNAGINYFADARGLYYADIVHILAGNDTLLTVERYGAGTVGDPWSLIVNLATDSGGLPISSAKQVKTAVDRVTGAWFDSVNSGIQWETVVGEYAVVSYVDPGGSSQSLTLDAPTGTGTSGDPWILVVNLSTDGGSAIDTTATALKAAVDGDGDWNAKVTLTQQGTGGDVVTAHAATPLDPMSDILFLVLADGSGTGTVAALTLAPLVAPADAYLEVADTSGLLLEGYRNTDPEWIAIAAMNAQEQSPPVIAVFPRATGADISDTLDNLVLDHDDWFALNINNHTKPEIYDAATWCNNRPAGSVKMGFFSSAVTDIVTGRTGEFESYIRHWDAASFPEAAWAGRALPEDPGSITWDKLILKGQVATTDNDTQLLALQAENGNWLEQWKTTNVVSRNGKTASGEWIDVIRGREWVRVNMEADVLELLVDANTAGDKITMDNEGIGRVEDVIRNRLKLAGEQGIIAKVETEADQIHSDDNEFMFTVTSPDRADITPEDRGNRILRDLKWAYFLAGAVHEALIDGIIKV